MKASPSFLTMDNLCEDYNLAQQPLPDPLATCPNVLPSSDLTASLPGDAVADSSTNVADPPIDTAPVAPSLSLSTPSPPPSSSAIPLAPPSSSFIPPPPPSSSSPMPGPAGRDDPIFEPELLENMPSLLSPPARTPIMELLNGIFPTPGATVTASTKLSVQPQEGHRSQRPWPPWRLWISVPWPQG